MLLLALVRRRCMMHLRPSWTRRRGAAVVSRTAGFSGQRGALHGVELVERGTHTMPVFFDVSHLPRRVMRLLQVLGGLDGVDGGVEWCMQVHDGDV
jgi:hypothetical protein